ncbi:class I SAM-dependent methyltransferase [bacterium]|nr:class I SAM-dependent methyltransferase [bacterium]
MFTTMLGYVLLGVQKLYNLFISRAKPSAHQFSNMKEFQEIQERAYRYTDFSDHLVTLFEETLSAQPKLIVELGTRGGDSTYVLERAARLCQADFVSVDIEDCSKVATYDRWYFVKSDDIEFAKRFSAWCREKGLPEHIDVLFIDSSHFYEHTCQEIEAWFPHLSEKAKAVFHDTNLKRIYFRKDGSMGIAWNNRRGVIRAIEEYFSTVFQEKKDFRDTRPGWRIKHLAYCAGFTVLEKLGKNRE